MGLANDEAEEWAGADADDVEESFEIYAENAPAVAVFTSMATQWQWTGGMQSYRCGLNHAVLQLHMDKCRVPRERQFEVMDDVQAMERAALQVWNEQAT